MHQKEATTGILLAIGPRLSAGLPQPPGARSLRILRAPKGAGRREWSELTKILLLALTPKATKGSLGARDADFAGGSKRHYQSAPIGARNQQRTRVLCACMCESMVIHGVGGGVVGGWIGRGGVRCDRPDPSIPSVPLECASRIAEPVPGVCAGEAVVREEWWWDVSSGWCGGRKGAELLEHYRAPLEGRSRTRMKRTLVRSRVASGKRCPQSSAGSCGGCRNPRVVVATKLLRKSWRSQPPVGASPKPACGGHSPRAGVVPPRFRCG